MSLIVSAIKPTNSLNIGNYIGALRNWVELQDLQNSLFFVADLHAITVPQDPAQMRAAVRELVASYVAAGIDPEKSIIFAQSTVPAHAELAWILGCSTPLGWLNRMTQFKDIAGKNRENAGWGVYSYPVLMAADVLLYKGTHVPVGDDQKQHVELMRDMAQAFNRRYGTEFFPAPEPMMVSQGARIMNLRDGTRKMSKSDPSDWSRINLTDDTDTIAQKIRKAENRLGDAARHGRGAGGPSRGAEPDHDLQRAVRYDARGRDQSVRRFGLFDFQERIGGPDRLRHRTDHRQAEPAARQSRRAGPDHGPRHRTRKRDCGGDDAGREAAGRILGWHSAWCPPLPFRRCGEMQRSGLLSAPRMQYTAYRLQFPKEAPCSL